MFCCLVPTKLYYDRPKIVTCVEMKGLVCMLWFNLIFGWNCLKPVYFFQTSLLFSNQFNYWNRCKDGKSLVYNANKVGPRTEPWGIPTETDFILDLTPFCSWRALSVQQNWRAPFANILIQPTSCDKQKAASVRHYAIFRFPRSSLLFV